MGKKVEKVKNWVKDHKKEIAIGIAFGIVGGPIIYHEGRKVYEIQKSMRDYKLKNAGLVEQFNKGMEIIPNSVAKRQEITIPKFEGMTCIDAARDGKKGMVVWLDGCKIESMGKLGENLLKMEERVSPNTVATMVTLWNYDKE